MEVEVFAQLQPQRPLGRGIFGKTDTEDGGWAPIEVHPLFGGENGQTSVFSGVADGGTQSSNGIGGHGCIFLRKSNCTELNAGEREGDQRAALPAGRSFKLLQQLP